ncbi:hypothetical protein [Vulcanococcus limneticus]|uniref:hypothetical protein n=1 Tax=Vulcanococcus limneticus TaxID=2170428 RepID=UPI00398C0AA9
MSSRQPGAYRWIKTDCGRAQYDVLAARTGPWAPLRLAWFVAIAALRDWRLEQPPEPGPGTGETP